MSLSRRTAWSFATLTAFLALALAQPAGARTPSEPQVLRLGATADGVTVVAQQPVQFMDTSLGEILTWTWDFSYEPGIPAVDSAEQNPLWTFAEAGLWAVRLEVCNEAGCSNAVKQIEVVEPCLFEADLVVGPLAGPVNDDQTFEACHTITAGEGVTVVGPGGFATFRAGRSVAFGSGFSIDSGGRLRVEIDSRLAVP